MSENMGNEKQGRVNGKNSKYRSGSKRIPKDCRNQIYVICKENGRNAASSEKSVGTATQNKRKADILLFFSDLFNLGFKIESIFNLKQKHVKAVFNFLEEQGQAPSTIQNKLSVMRVFCRWIGKHGMIGDSQNYVKNKSSSRRSMVVKEDKSWVGNGVDVSSKLQEIGKLDIAVMLWMEICLAFGLRIKEAISAKVAVAEDGGCFLVREGTKGNRPRVVPIENDIQRDVLRRAQSEADGKTGFLGGRGKSYEQKKRHCYYILRKCGITLSDEGVSAHGLRHQYMHESFKNLLGIEPPVRGGDLNDVDKDKLLIATWKLVERAGHSRAAIGASYYGSRRRAKKTSQNVGDTEV